MNKTLPVLVAFVAISVSGAALAAATPAGTTSTEASVMTGIIVAQSTNGETNGVRDYGSGGGRNDVGQNKGNDRNGPKNQ